MFKRESLLYDPIASFDRYASSLLQFKFSLIGRVVIINPMSGIQVCDLDAVMIEQPGNPIKINPVANKQRIRFFRLKDVVMRIDHIHRIPQVRKRSRDLQAPPLAGV
ncbi:MAG: hypothetical protein HC801_11165 [Nitrospira sp.]|nr:hypothetical protein [Nitrospira sp.]